LAHTREQLERVSASLNEELAKNNSNESRIENLGSELQRVNDTLGAAIDGIDNQLRGVLNPGKKTAQTIQAIKTGGRPPAEQAGDLLRVFAGKIASLKTEIGKGRQRLEEQTAQAREARAEADERERDHVSSMSRLWRGNAALGDQVVADQEHIADLQRENAALGDQVVADQEQIANLRDENAILIRQLAEAVERLAAAEELARRQKNASRE
jgi:chromosome segregation ATPase